MRFRTKVMPNINLELQVLPKVPDEMTYQVVDQVIAYIDSTGFKYEVGPMGTTMEGELTELLAVVEKAQTICVEAGASRVLSVIKIDYKPEGVTMDEKIKKYR